MLGVQVAQNLLCMDSTIMCRCWAPQARLVLVLDGPSGTSGQDHGHDSYKQLVCLLCCYHRQGHMNADTRATVRFCDQNKKIQWLLCCCYNNRCYDGYCEL